MSHTPGPWVAVGMTIRINRAAGDREHGMGICDVWPWLPDVHGNINLIAAAPELLEALEGLITVMGYTGSDLGTRFATEDALDRARAAIRKARGSE